MKKITILFLGFLVVISANSQVVLTENFDDITTLAGWNQVNVSSTIGTTTWFQGNPASFPSYNGATSSYIGANYNATTGVGTISNWLILPVLSLKDGDILTFYTRTATASAWPDRLQVRVSADGAASTAPTNATDEGSYTTLLLDINPTLAVGGYPNANWELQSVTISGLGSTAIDARLAFRYFVTNGGPSGSNSNYIGIDALEVNQTLSIEDFAAKQIHIACKDRIVTISNIQGIADYNVYSITGKKVFEGQTRLESQEIDLNHLASGVYIVEITNADNQRSERKKVVIN